MEQLSHGTLAERIKASPIKNPDKFRDQGVARLVGHAATMWKKLEKGEYEKDESGYIQFAGIDTSDWDSPGVVINGFHVEHVDPTGYTVPLGSVHQYSSALKGPGALVNTSICETEPLYPNDPRWDAIVRALGRAIVTCEAPKS